MKWTKKESSPDKKKIEEVKVNNNSNYSLKEIIYTRPNKPLDYSFRDITYMKDLINAVPRQGVRKQIIVVQNESDEKRNIADDKSKDISSLLMNNKKKAKEVKEELVEGKIFGEKVTDKKNKRSSDANNFGKYQGNQQSEKLAIKNVIKYLPYTNSIILHSNGIKSLSDITNALQEILPEVEFLNNKQKKDVKKDISMPKNIDMNFTKLDLIQWIDLSHNKLESIHKDILELRYLKILYLHANLIKNLEEITVLSNSKALINLTLHGNPIEHIKGYRLLVIEMIPTLEKLDFTLVSEKELDIIHFRGAKFGEKRNKQGVVTVFPKLDKEILSRMNLTQKDSKAD